MMNAQILEAAGAFLGLEEYPGAKHNPAIIEMARDVGHEWVQDDETPWCASFVGSILASVGLPHTGSLRARSYLEYGIKVSMQKAMPGDIVVLWRGHPDGTAGHVGFLVRWEGDSAIIRGGNQSDRVSDAPYPTSRILGIRRAMAIPSNGRPVLRSGSHGAFVLDLQDQLNRLGYFAGQRDGIFGPRTKAAVLAFQAEHGLVTDGIVGARTWLALEETVPRDERELDLKDLRARGSETVRRADQIEVGAAIATGVTSVGVVVDQVEAAADTLDRSSGLLERLSAIVSDSWPALIAIGVLLGVIYAAHRVREARLRDARSGAHMGR